VRTPTGPPPIPIPEGTTASADGIAVGDGRIALDAYIDFLCPFCKQFEERCGPMLDRMVAERIITLAYHPMGFLDRLSTTRYSSRAAASSGCASDEEKFPEYADALFANQPPEGGPGLSEAELVELGRSVGINHPRFTRCVSNGTYLAWAEYVTATALARGVSGTPSVFVEGVPVPANPETIAAAVAAVPA
jgi:protein-disulfide isomerase